MEYKDYYKVLGLTKEATQDDIKRVYRKLARKYHPDISKEDNAEEQFKEVGEAYEVLKDPEKRAAYDQLGEDLKAPRDFRPPPSGTAGTGQSADFDDFLANLFGQRGRANAGRTQSMQGEDSHFKVSIDLEDAYRGATRSLNLRSSQQERTLNIKIPKGVKQGQHIRLQGQGSPGIGGGSAGDLYLEIAFNPHPLYRAEELDVYLELPIAPWEAALGGSVKVPTPDGAVDMKIPPNSSTGRKLRLKGRGIPAQTPGDFYVTLKVVMPDTLSDKAKALYSELALEQTFNPRAGMGV
ncbi:DnaJ C-terminal domain-containing protein [Thiothrix winogradskyi]|uniref:DnaJ domain-containing protein n=1 Tax=Thiothrix winogradskyi TaxID=96472 RepID=A0ABY3SUZ6_9GAMM|nr:DnaJ C-terminal domain-containing protein [Thiothrix winogradskyi]UJS22983.1 DnaJ domain-containing protein [Thiothrix winogradskyi]